MKILLRASFSQLSGYGRDGIGLAQALLDRGHDVRISPAHVDVPIPREIAGLLTMAIDPPFDLAIHHMEAELADLPLSDALCARYNALWTMWGWPDVPDEEWVPTLVERWQNFDSIVVYDPDSADAFAPHIGTDRLKTVLGGYAADDWSDPLEEPVPDHPFRFGMNGRLTLRKGVYSTYPAFVELQEKHGEAFDAELVLRTTQPIFPPQFEVADRVEVIVSRAEPEELRLWYHSLDTLVAPSMAEAKHLPPIEALTCGVPVILSDITGHRTWATDDMVTYVPTKPHEPQKGYVGGQVSTQDLADAMWLHYTQASAQRVKAALAARTLPAMLDWTKCVERFGYTIGMRL